MSLPQDTRLAARLAARRAARRARALTWALGLALLACDEQGQGAEGGDAGTPSLYPQVEAILTRSCAIARCHSGPIFGAGLLLSPGSDFRAILVGVPACEYERMALVEPGQPDASWMMVKLTAPFRPPLDPYASYIEFDPPPDWNPDERRCRDVSDAGEPLFGQRMPATAPNQLPEADLQVIEDWIAQGALP